MNRLSCLLAGLAASALFVWFVITFFTFAP